MYVTSEMATKAGESGDERYSASSHGLDSVEFLLAPGPTEPLRQVLLSSLSVHCLNVSRSLSAVASGGESARIMLAFKAVPLQMRNTFGNSKTKEAEGNLKIH